MLMFVAIALGVVQGLGEFLPISSSGHLILAQSIFGLKESEVAFDVVLHLGTLAAVCIYYRETLLTLIKELRFLPGAIISPKRLGELYQTRPDFRFGILIVIASIPTGIMGLALKDIFKANFTSVFSVAIALLITGTILRLVGSRGKTGRDAKEMNIRDAIIIGTIQGLAIIPGFSRSGFTICAGLFSGLNRITAARFSFILSIPAIIGATAIELTSIEQSAFSTTEFIVGFFTAAIVGYLSLALLVKLLKQDNFSIFSWWCWAVGLIALTWTFLG